MLYTKFSTLSGIGNHGSLITDASTPLRDGTPIFTTVWEYLLGICDISTSPARGLDFIGVLVTPNPTHGLLQVKSTLEISKIGVYNLSENHLKSVYPNRPMFRIDLDSHKGLHLLKISLKGSAFQVVEKGLGTLTILSFEAC